MSTSTFVRRSIASAVTLSAFTLLLTTCVNVARTAQDAPAVQHAQESKQEKPHHGEHDHDAGDHARATHRFEDAKKWAGIWDHPSRDEWQQPEHVVKMMQIEAGMTVVDIGAGTGYFNPYLSRAVGTEGTVYAVDVEESLVAHMSERARKDGTPNVHPVLGLADDPRIPEGPVDRVLLVDTYHHIDARIEYFRRLAQRLAPGALLVNVDWKPGELALGPSPDHKLHPRQVRIELEQAGFELQDEQNLEYQYVQVFRRVPSSP